MQRLSCKALPCAVLVYSVRGQLMVSAKHRVVYVNSLLDNSPSLPEGWMDPLSAYTVALLSRAQHAMGVSGSVGEIGVHHGLFFVALAHTALVGEHMFACDTFGQQDDNIDKSGYGDQSAFKDTLQRFGICPSNVWVHAGQSQTLKVWTLQVHGLIPVRLLSIDGDHSVHATLHGLTLAARAVAHGGIVALDDFTQPLFMEVREGLYRFLCPRIQYNESQCGRRRPTLAPFLLLCNKLYLTTPSHHGLYLKVIRDDSWSPVAVAPEQTGFGRSRIAGWPVAVQGEREHYEARCGPWRRGVSDSEEVLKVLAPAWREMVAHEDILQEVIK